MSKGLRLKENIFFLLCFFLCDCFAPILSKCSYETKSQSLKMREHEAFELQCFETAT